MHFRAQGGGAGRKEELIKELEKIVVELNSSQDVAADSLHHVVAHAVENGGGERGARSDVLVKSASRLTQEGRPSEVKRTESGTSICTTSRLIETSAPRDLTPTHVTNHVTAHVTTESISPTQSACSIKSICRADSSSRSPSAAEAGAGMMGVGIWWASPNKLRSSLAMVLSQVAALRSTPPHIASLPTLGQGTAEVDQEEAAAAAAAQAAPGRASEDTLHHTSSTSSARGEEQGNKAARSRQQQSLSNPNTSLTKQINNSPSTHELHEELKEELKEEPPR